MKRPLQIAGHGYVKGNGFVLRGRGRYETHPLTRQARQLVGPHDLMEMIRDRFDITHFADLGEIEITVTQVHD